MVCLSHTESVRSYYNLILKKAGQFITHLQVNLLRFALSLRTYSPAVAAAQQIASDEPMPESCPIASDEPMPESCPVFVPRPYLYKTDHRYPGPERNMTETPVVILYAEIGTRKFSAFHANPQPHKVLLSGYAVELAIKSTEYRAVDDTQGFLPLPGRKSHPELQAPLAELRRHLVESSDDMAPLKVWQLQDLSFQAASRILSVPKFDSLKLMRELSQDFPSKARSLTRVTVKPEMRKEIEENQKHLSETMGVQPGDAALFINGQNIDLDTHNPFSILDMLRGEARLLEGLHHLGVTGEPQGKLLRLPVAVAKLI
ncbi:hypothetical protein CRUP_018420 [Coryphaenoides rupestris]|nr:hypothetical protein CRUP_018420 [Coryphaenoides rupestris]